MEYNVFEALSMALENIKMAAEARKTILDNGVPNYNRYRYSRPGNGF